MVAKVWFIFIHSSNHKDHKYATKLVKTLVNGSRSHSDLHIYIAWFGPTRSSPAHLVHINTGHLVVIETVVTLQDVSPVRVLDHFTDLIPRRVHAFCGSFHGSGWCIGPWKRSKLCFMTTKDLIHVTIDKLKIPLVCFDSCYMGNLSCLYELPACVKYTVASPGFHPYHSLIEVSSFCQLGAIGDLKEFAIQLANNWMDLAWPKARYSCLIVFDMKVIPRLVSELSAYWPSLVFGEWSRIDKEDANLSDLWLASENAPVIRDLIQQCVLNSDRIRSCNKKVRGPSVERWMPRKWQDLFKQTKFYKHVLTSHWSSKTKSPSSTSL